MKNAPTKSAKPQLYRELAIALCLILAVVASRMWIDVPNFKPVMAIALLAGFLFSRRWLGFVTTMAGMLVSDLLIGFYDIRVLLVVYIALVCPLLGGMFMHRWKNQPGRLAGSVVGFGALSALNFYILTTLSVWLCFTWYPPNVAGLGAAFAMGLPFFKWTLFANIVFSTLLFGGLMAARATPLPARRKRPVPFPAARTGR